VRKYPDSSADLILLYFQSPIKYFYASDHVTNVWRELCQSEVSRDKLKKIREAMFRWDADPGEP
jgi:hypothetical protein